MTALIDLLAAARDALQHHTDQTRPIWRTNEMVEASRGVKRQRMLVAAGMLKQGKRPDTISMSLATDEEWAAMIAAAPSAQKEG